MSFCDPSNVQTLIFFTRFGFLGETTSRKHCSQSYWGWFWNGDPAQTKSNPGFDGHFHKIRIYRPKCCSKVIFLTRFGFYAKNGLRNHWAFVDFEKKLHIRPPLLIDGLGLIPGEVKHFQQLDSMNVKCLHGPVYCKMLISCFSEENRKRIWCEFHGKCSLIFTCVLVFASVTTLARLWAFFNYIHQPP